MADSDSIRVMVVDDHDMVRRGLAAFLKAEAGVELVGEASNGEEALRVCERVRPDVVLMDMVMPRMDGREATSVLRERWPEVQVIALTSFNEKDLVQGAIEAGAIGFLLKNVSTDELADAIRTAHAGQVTMASEAAQVLALAEKLERLESAVLESGSDLPTLSGLVKEHAPDMFPQSRIYVQLFPDHVLLHHPPDGTPAPKQVWQWLRGESQPRTFYAESELPWGGHLPGREAMIAAPIMDKEAVEAMGGICVLLPHDPDGIINLLPAVQGLSVQIAWALRRERLQAEALAHQRVAEEIALAGRIQASFLPQAVPELPGWQLAATLQPARETSGDFYDFVPLSNGRLGIVVADVADKGMGAALYMALSCTLIRTFAAKHPERPDLVFRAASRRILADTRAGLFVSAFYGILDSDSGTLDYCSAGHNPPYLLRGRDAGEVIQLRPTGMFLGVMEDATWGQASVEMFPEDVLVLYTDGVIDSQDAQGEFFGQERLLDMAQTIRGGSARGILDELMSQVRGFSIGTPQFDDMAMMIVTRT